MPQVLNFAVIVNLKIKLMKAYYKRQIKRNQKCVLFHTPEVEPAPLLHGRLSPESSLNVFTQFPRTSPPWVRGRKQFCMSLGLKAVVTWDVKQTEHELCPKG